MLRKHEDCRHLVVKARGRFLTVVALDEDDDDGQPVARLERLEPEQYGLAIMWHNDKWQQIPISGTLEELVSMLRQEFGALIAAP